MVDDRESRDDVDRRDQEKRSEVWRIGPIKRNEVACLESIQSSGSEQADLENRHESNWGD